MKDVPTYVGKFGLPYEDQQDQELPQYVSGIRVDQLGNPSSDKTTGNTSRCLGEEEETCLAVIQGAATTTTTGTANISSRPAYCVELQGYFNPCICMRAHRRHIIRRSNVSLFTLMDNRSSTPSSRA